MTEREWFAEDDPMVLLRFIQEVWDVPLLEGPPRERRGEVPNSPPSQGEWRMSELYLSSPDSGQVDPARAQEAELLRLLHRYLLACCRAIWPLLPREGSRRGVEVTELLIEGRASKEEYHRAEYQAEGAAFFLEYMPHEPETSEEMRAFYEEMDRERVQSDSPEEQRVLQQYEADRKPVIERLVREVAAIPAEAMRRMVRAVPGVEPWTPRRLLHRAAYFADFAICYPGIRPREGVLERYPEFLSVNLLRQVIRYPKRPSLPRSGHVWWSRYGTDA